MKKKQKICESFGWQKKRSSLPKGNLRITLNMFNINMFQTQKKMCFQSSMTTMMKIMTKMKQKSKKQKKKIPNTWCLIEFRMIFRLFCILLTKTVTALPLERVPFLFGIIWCGRVLEEIGAFAPLPSTSICTANLSEVLHC